MIPTELATFGSSVVVGGGLKVFAQYMAARSKREEERDRFIANRDKEHSTRLKEARAFLPQGGEWTRRLIVIACMIALIAPTLLPALFPGLTVSYAYSEAKGAWWIFQTSLETLKTVELRGIVILPLHTHVCSAVAGFYFGAGIAKVRG